MKTITIKKWSETFENADSRKRQRLGFFYAPSGCDSAGYLALMSEFEPADAWQTLGIFTALCQHAATMRREVRGSFINSSGKPMTTRQIAMLIRCDHDLLLRSLDLLCDERVRWISADDLPDACQSSADDVPPSSLVCGKAKDKDKDKDKAKAKRQGQGQGQGQAQEQNTPPSSEPSPLDELKTRINNLRPEWQKPARWAYSEEQFLHGGAAAQMAELDADDWKTLTRFFKAYVDNAKAFWRPNSRSKFVETFADVWASCQRWSSKHKPRVSQPRPPEPEEPQAVDISEYATELAAFKQTHNIEDSDQAIADDPKRWADFMTYFFKSITQ